jgi:stalled ribosome rescue protein Dom34
MTLTRNAEGLELNLASEDFILPVKGKHMAEHFHAVVWIDHREAKIFHFSPTDANEKVVHPSDPHVHIHHHANSIGSGHAAEDQKFLHAVAAEMAKSKAVLIIGPANAKHELVKHIEAHDPTIAKIIAGVEAADHPGDGDIVAHARAFFKHADKTTPQKV